MSVLFPKVNKPREWDYRPIYFDKEKEARKEKHLARLHQVSFREEHERNMSQMQKRHKSHLLLWVVLLAVVVILMFYVL